MSCSHLNSCYSPSREDDWRSQVAGSLSWVSAGTLLLPPPEQGNEQSRAHHNALPTPGLSTSIDLGASMYPERPTSIDFGPILHSIFVVFRGDIVRANRHAARCAEPSFLLAGAVLWRVRRHSHNAENRSSLSKHRTGDSSQKSGACELRRLSFLRVTWCRFW